MMDAADYAFVIGCVLVLAVLSFGSYRFGKWQERKDYTASYVTQVNAAFWEGYEEAKKQQMLVPQR